MQRQRTGWDRARRARARRTACRRTGVRARRSCPSAAAFGLWLVLLTAPHARADEACGGGGPLTGPGGDIGGPYLERTLLTSHGEERRYLLRLPAGYDAGVRHDVVFTLHGAGNDAETQLDYSHFMELADRDGAIVVSPDANDSYPDREHPLAEFWDSAWEAHQREREVDIDFLLELAATLEAEYCTGSFFAAGMSAGGDMVTTLACQPATPFAAYAAVAWGHYDSVACAAVAARPMLYFHGDNDPIIPYEGGQEPWFDPPVPDMMQAWADHNGCAPTLYEEDVAEDVIRYDWDECEVATAWYRVIGGKHGWPGSYDIPVIGETTQNISATALMWEHFGVEAVPEPQGVSGALVVLLAIAGLGRRGRAGDSLQTAPAARGRLGGGECR